MWEWLEAIHDFMCDIPTIGDLFDEYPVVAYGILFISIGAYIYFKFS